MTILKYKFIGLGQRVLSFHILVDNAKLSPESLFWVIVLFLNIFANGYY